MTGLHSIDVGIMVAPVLVELMISSADAADIEYTVGTEPKKREGSTKASIAAALEESDMEPTMEFDMESEVEEVESPAEEMEEPSMGMMARRSV
jgi:hypothetical protein